MKLGQHSGYLANPLFIYKSRLNRTINSLLVFYQILFPIKRNLTSRFLDVNSKKCNQIILSLKIVLFFWSSVPLQLEINFQWLQFVKRLCIHNFELFLSGRIFLNLRLNLLRYSIMVCHTKLPKRLLYLLENTRHCYLLAHRKNHSYLIVCVDEVRKSPKYVTFDVMVK
jgi:hypothetical protein